MEYGKGSTPIQAIEFIVSGSVIEQVPVDQQWEIYPIQGTVEFSLDNQFNALVDLRVEAAGKIRANTIGSTNIVELNTRRITVRPQYFVRYSGTLLRLRYEAVN